mmetsp:Transcript_123902/g.300864  ORF Transcript_123902/g.300864 Transcript_123902/m.300864 type:complete len:210 (-) Transcript_123902:330-959(-)
MRRAHGGLCHGLVDGLSPTCSGPYSHMCGWCGRRRLARGRGAAGGLGGAAGGGLILLHSHVHRRGVLQRAPGRGGGRGRAAVLVLLGDLEGVDHGDAAPPPPQAGSRPLRRAGGARAGGPPRRSRGLLLIGARAEGLPGPRCGGEITARRTATARRVPRQSQLVLLAGGALRRLQRLQLHPGAHPDGALPLFTRRGCRTLGSDIRSSLL